MRIHDMQHCAAATLRPYRESAMAIYLFAKRIQFAHQDIFHGAFVLCMRVYVYARAHALLAFAYPQAKLHWRFFFLRHFSFYDCKNSTIAAMLFSMRLARLPCLYNASNAMSLRIVAQAKSQQSVSQSFNQTFIPFLKCIGILATDCCLIRFDYSSCNLRLPRIGASETRLRLVYQRCNEKYNVVDEVI